MDQPLPEEKKSPLDVCSYIDILLGSTVRDIAEGERLLWARSGTDRDLLFQYLFFDFPDHPPGRLISRDGSEPKSFWGPEACVAAVLPSDRQALQRARDEGFLWPIPEGSENTHTISLDNMGASGDPRVGLVLALLNRSVLSRRLQRLIRKARDHARQSTLVLEGMDDSSVNGRLVMRLLFSTVGGTGAGSFLWFLGEDGIRRCAREDGAEANVILHVIGRGSLPTHDTPSADVNQYVTLKYLQAVSTGCYVSPFSGQISPVPFDQLIFSTNQNAHGNLQTLDELLMHESHCDHFLYTTPAGARMRERLPDIMTCKSDDNGDPQVAYTMSCAELGCDRKRIASFTRNKAASALAGSFLAVGDTERIRERAAGLARSLQMVESDQENQITARLSRPAELAGENVGERARASFNDHIEGLRGLPKALGASDSLNAILDNDIPAVYEPAMRSEARKHLGEVTEALDRDLQERMRNPTGLRDSQKQLGFLKVVAENSAHSLAAKVNELQDLRRPHVHIIAEGREQLDALREVGRWRRWLNSRRVHAIAASIEQSARVLIGAELELAACEIASREFMAGLLEYLDRKLAWLSVKIQDLIQLAQVFENEADRIAENSTVFEVPLGLELTTKQFLTDYYQSHILTSGGPDQFTAALQGRFLKEYESLADWIEAPLHECRAALTAIGEEAFAAGLERLSVAKEFRRRYPEKNKQRQILAELVKQSEGRLLVTGELNKHVPWIKTANVSFREDVEWLREILESVDKKEGKWDVAVDPHSEKISVGQVRGGIPLGPFLRQLDLPDDRAGWEQLIERAPDPVSALLVPPNPNLRQFRRVLAKAVATGLLTVDEEGRFVLRSSTGEFLILGETFEAVERKLRRNWRQLVFIESTFGWQVISDEPRIIPAVNVLQMDLEAAGSDRDKRLGLIDLKAVHECQEQLDLFDNWARRVRLAIEKRGRQ